MAIAKLTSKGQAVIPKEIRERLGLKPGDDVSFELMIGNAVIMDRVSPNDIDYLIAISESLCEWDSDADEKAFCLL